MEPAHFPRGTWHGANLKPIGGSIDLDSGLLEEPGDELGGGWFARSFPSARRTGHLDDDGPRRQAELQLVLAFGWLTDFRVTARASRR